MTTRAVPSPEQVLRGLFWKLLFRGRAALPQQSRRRKQLGLGPTLALYGLFGLMPAVAAFVAPPLVFASSLHAFTLLFASLTLASAVGTMLFVREEAEILLHRPVLPAQLLRAKVAVLVAHSLLLALALNAAGLVTGFWSKGNAPWFAAAHVVSTLLLMTLSAAAVVLVYNVCLRWFGRERFENLLTLVQVLLAIVMVAGSQLLPRMLDQVEGVDIRGGWAMALPPVWFGAVDMVLCGVDATQLWPFALLAVGLTAVVSWLAFARLGAAYGRGLLALNETAAPDAERPVPAGGRRLGRLARAAPLRWWLRDPIERQAFLLTSAYLLRDRETKLKLYPGLAPMLVMPLLLAIGPGHRRDQQSLSAVLTAMGLAYTVIVPLQALTMLQRSEHWRAAAAFRTAALPHWAPLFLGARKAVLTWIALPALALVTGALALVQQSPLPLALAIPSLAILPVCAMLPATGREWLPLSMPNEDIRNQTGCVMFAVSVVVSMLVGIAGGGLLTVGWFWPYAVVVVLASIMLQRRLARSMRARRWCAAEA